MSEWQPIETAPKNGTWVLVFVPNAWGKQGEIHVGLCITDDLWNIGGNVSFDIGNPTHWQPLPEPPMAEWAPPHARGWSLTTLRAQLAEAREGFQRINAMLSENHTFDELSRDAGYSADIARAVLAKLQPSGESQHG